MFQGSMEKRGQLNYNLIYEFRFSFKVMLDVVGNTFIALVVLSIHARIAKERAIDDKVVEVMKREKILVVLGIIFVVLGYILRVLGFVF